LNYGDGIIFLQGQGRMGASLGRSLHLNKSMDIKLFMMSASMACPLNSKIPGISGIRNSDSFAYFTAYIATHSGTKSP
jgi:hypothetical protein